VRRITNYGVVMTCVPMSVLPAASASATTVRSDISGSNPNSAMCNAIRSNSSLRAGIKVAEAQGQKATEAGNWTVAKKYLSLVAADGLKEVQRVKPLITGEPADVSAALAALFKFAKLETVDTKEADGFSQYASLVGRLEKNVHVPRVDKTVSQYFLGQCGGSASGQI
jgi:hypothetical protein